MEVIFDFPESATQQKLEQEFRCFSYYGRGVVYVVVDVNMVDVDKQLYWGLLFRPLVGLLNFLHYFSLFDTNSCICLNACHYCIAVWKVRQPVNFCICQCHPATRIAPLIFTAYRRWIHTSGETYAFAIL